MVDRDTPLPGRVQLRRRGRGLGLRGVLVERDGELGLVEQRLAAVRAGRGNVIFIEAPAGKGKSRLLTAAGDMAREAEMQVLGAQGTELEHDFPFGVAIQLFEPRWIAADPAERARMSQGPAARASELLSGPAPQRPPDPADRGYSMMQGLFWLSCNLALGDREASRPLLMLVDDAHCGDGPSLRFLAYLARRISKLPIGLVVAVRSGEPVADPAAVTSLRSAAEDAVLRPDSLSAEGVTAIVRSWFPEAEETFCRACARVTSGNAFLLIELLGQVDIERQAPDAATAARLEELAPESVLHSVLGRLSSLPDDARGVAQAVAVLGDGAPLEQVSQLSGLTMRQAARGADALSAGHLFHPGSPLAFIHPLIASSVRASMSPLDRAAAHRRAAMILTGSGAPDEQVAVHLMASPPESDPRAVQSLRAAARTAMARGAAESAVRMLGRALAERPASDVYPEVLSELAQAEYAAGLPNAVDRLHEAISVIAEAPRRAELALAQARALHLQQRFADAAKVLARAAQDLDPGDVELAEQVEAAYIAAALFVPERIADAGRRGERLKARIAGAPTASQRHALAHMALHAGLRGGERATAVRLAELAWSDGAPLQPAAVDRASWPVLAAALLFVDELERDLEICDVALAAAGARDSSSAYALASFTRAWPLYESGRIREASSAANAALDAKATYNYSRTAYAAMACCHLQAGHLEQAETALSIIDHPDVRESGELGFLLEVRAQLRLAQLRAGEALDDAREAGAQLQHAFGAVSPGAVPWRSTAALAHIALGQADSASELAAEELERARAGGLTRIVIRDLRVLGLAARGPRGLELLEEAVRTGDQYPTRLEHIRALLDFGAALRRANQRVAAREPLRQALELSHRGGATALCERARAELSASGARPRRAMLSGLESLTPSERRVAEVAATGLTTRRISETLFVSPKTVEFHLRHIYQKLDISSRAELTKLLSQDEDAGA